jgi:CheY-like chemotaxis protein
MSSDKGIIMVVEDNELQRNLMSENLRQEGYEVFEAPNRKEAWKSSNRSWQKSRWLIISSESNPVWS